MSNLETKEKKLVSFNDDEATIRFSHKTIQTAENAELLRQYFQQRISRAVNREIPLKEITIYPDVGQESEAETTFIVRRERPLYLGLNLIHQETPDALPRLVEDLDDFAIQNELDEIQLGLVRHAISELQQIIEPSVQG